MLLATGHHSGELALTRVSDRTASNVWRLDRHEATVTSVALLDHDRIITGGMDRAVRVTPVAGLSGDEPHSSSTSVATVCCSSVPVPVRRPGSCRTPNRWVRLAPRAAEQRLIRRASVRCRRRRGCSAAPPTRRVETRRRAPSHPRRGRYPQPHQPAIRVPVVLAGVDEVRKVWHIPGVGHASPSPAHRCGASGTGAAAQPVGPVDEVGGRVRVAEGGQPVLLAASVAAGGDAPSLPAV